MNCNECFEAFSSALDGELDPADQLEMEEHLEECADCRSLRTRMLALSADLKTQAFPQPTDLELKTLAKNALEGAQMTQVGWLRQFLSLPYSNWPLKLFLRSLSIASLISLVLLGFVQKQLLPAYTGMEAVSKNGLPDLQSWFSWSPSSGLLFWTAIGVWVIGLWTCGLPGFFIDLWNETRLVLRDILRLGLGALCLGPMIGLPLLVELELGSYLLLCCAWSAFCLLASYLVVVFKTQRPLPKLAGDFVALLLTIGILEWVARNSARLPDAKSLAPYLASLVGSFTFSEITQGLGFLSLCGFCLWLGLTGLIPSYRSSGGQVLASLLLLSGLGLSFYALSRRGEVRVAEALKVETKGERQVYLLGSTKEDPWLLSHEPYPTLDLHILESETTPRATRLRLAQALLDWDEQKSLEIVEEWGKQAPGVTWGLAQFVHHLGERQQNLLSVPTEERRRVVSGLLSKLRWRILNDVSLSEETGLVKGHLEGLSGVNSQVPIRLIPIEANQSLSQVLETLEQELEFARQLGNEDNLSPEFFLSGQRSIIIKGQESFEFPKVPAGRYVLAVLLNQPEELTLNSSIPGVFELVQGQELDLGAIKISRGKRGEDVKLAASSWSTEGQVEFSSTSEATTVKLREGAAISGFVETEIFDGGRATLKVLAQSSFDSKATLKARFFAKNGTLLGNWKLNLSANTDFYDLKIETKDAQGYLQLFISSERGEITVRNIKLEALQ